MNCIHCGTSTRRKDRTGGRCPQCKHAFAFEPTTNPHKLTDPVFKGAIGRVSADGALSYTPRQLFYALNRVRRKGRSYGPPKVWWGTAGDTRRAVSEGLAASARTITSAALIMVAVFAVFVGTGVPSIKQLGLGNAVAIAVDATLVRLVLVPAAMELLGKWNWYLPAWLDRILPRSSFEQLPDPMEQIPVLERHPEPREAAVA